MGKLPGVALFWVAFCAFFIATGSHAAVNRQPLCQCNCCVETIGQCLPPDDNTVPVSDCSDCYNDLCMNLYALCRSPEATVASICINPNSVFDVVLICILLLMALMLLILSFAQYKVPYIYEIFHGKHEMAPTKDHKIPLRAMNLSQVPLEPKESVETVTESTSLLSRFRRPIQRPLSPDPSEGINA